MALSRRHLRAAIVQYGFSTIGIPTLNAAQLISRNLQIQGTFGGNSAKVDYVNPVEDAGRRHRVQPFVHHWGKLSHGHSEPIAR